MDFDKSQTVGDISITRVRAFLRDRQGSSFSRERVGQFFDFDILAAQAWIDIAVDLGFLAPYPRHMHFYQAGVLGLRLAASPLYAPLSREKGGQLVEDLLRRAELFSSSENRWNYLVEVEMLALFGSVLGGRDNEISDVDVLYKLQWLPEIRDSDNGLNQLCLDLFEKDNPNSSRILDYAIWPTLKLLRALRARSPYLSLHYWTQAELLNDAEVTIIYEWPFGRVASPHAMAAKNFVALFRERDDAKMPAPKTPTPRTRRA
jgi:hypothetical protein